jgi:D-3-phosphoglycerate dehydrogenase
MKESVNYVNAPDLAKTRGIKVKEVRSQETVDFADLITITVHSAKGEHIVAGTLFGAEARIVSIDNHRVDVDPQNWLLISPHINRPGVVGKVGTIMGENNINIGGMQVGRTTIAGTSIMVLSVDSEVPQDVMEKIKAIDGIFDLKLVNLNMG